MLARFSTSLSEKRLLASREDGASAGPSRLRVLVVTSRDSGGGAPRAIHRIFQALRQHHSAQLDVFLRVIHKSFNDDHIIGGKAVRSRMERTVYFLRTRFRKYFPRRPFVSDNPILHSQALFSTGLAREINSIDPDVVMLGWLGNSTLSVPEIGRIKAPIVWRLSDMWMIAGSEHYTNRNRYAVGYSRSSRPRTESGPDIDRETFRRKLRHWKPAQSVICPSNWMAGEVRKSQLTKEWPVRVIPNAIDVDTWRPVDRKEARAALRLPAFGKIVLFGAGSGLKDHHKGGDLLLEAIAQLSAKKNFNSEITSLVIFGQEGSPLRIGAVRVLFLGKLDDTALRQAYSAANVMVVPSRLDNFPSTAVEAQACGTPVVGFRTAGLSDVVEDKQTGLLVDAFEVDQLADSIQELLYDSNLERRLGTAARERAVAQWSPEEIARQYLEVFYESYGKTMTRPGVTSTESLNLSVYGRGTVSDQAGREW